MEDIKCFVISTEQAEYVAQIGQNLRGAGVCGGSFLQRGKGLVEAIGVGQDSGEIVLDAGVVGRNPQGLLESSFGITEAAQAAIDASELIVGFEAVGTKLGGFFEKLSGFSDAASVGAKLREKIEGFEVIAGAGEDLAISGVSFGKSAGTVELDGVKKSLLRGHLIGASGESVEVQFLPITWLTANTWLIAKSGVIWGLARVKG